MAFRDGPSPAPGSWTGVAHNESRGDLRPARSLAVRRMPDSGAPSRAKVACSTEDPLGGHGDSKATKLTRAGLGSRVALRVSTAISWSRNCMSLYPA